MLYLNYSHEQKLSNLVCLCLLHAQGSLILHKFPPNGKDFNNSSRNNSLNILGKKHNRAGFEIEFHAGVCQH